MATDGDDDADDDDMMNIDADACAGDSDAYAGIRSYN